MPLVLCYEKCILFDQGMLHSVPVNNVLKEIERQAGIVQLEGKCMIALSQQMGCILGLAITRKDALFVATDAGVGCITKVFIKYIFQTYR